MIAGPFAKWPGIRTPLSRGTIQQRGMRSCVTDHGLHICDRNGKIILATSRSSVVFGPLGSTKRITVNAPTAAALSLFLEAAETAAINPISVDDISNIDGRLKTVVLVEDSDAKAVRAAIRDVRASGAKGPGQVSAVEAVIEFIALELGKTTNFAGIFKGDPFKNTGVLEIIPPGPPFVYDGPIGSTLFEAGVEIAFGVTFAPTALGTFADEIRIVHENPTIPDTVIPIEGEGFIEIIEFGILEDFEDKAPGTLNGQNNWVVTSGNPQPMSMTEGIGFSPYGTGLAYIIGSQTPSPLGSTKQNFIRAEKEVLGGPLIVDKLQFFFTYAWNQPPLANVAERIINRAEWFAFLVAQQYRLQFDVRRQSNGDDLIVAQSNLKGQVRNDVFTLSPGPPVNVPVTPKFQFFGLGGFTPTALITIDVGGTTVKTLAFNPAILGPVPALDRAKGRIFVQQTTQAGTKPNQFVTIDDFKGVAE